MTDTSGGSPVSVVDDSVSLVKHGTDDQKPFPFFDLPPELRNIIYSFSVKDREFFDCYGIYDLKLLDYFQPSLQRVSKQFRHEYEKEVLKSAAIYSHVCRFYGLDQQFWRSSPFPRGLERLHLRIDYRRCYRDPGFRMIHREITKGMKTFSSVKTITLTIDLFVHQYDYLIDEEYVITEDLLRLPPVDGGRVKVQFELFLHSRLFKVLNRTQDSNGDPCRISWDTPMVTFRASPSIGPYTYKGLVLEVESIGDLDKIRSLCGIGYEDEEGWKSLYRP
ncbi:hypothetical protein KC354_g4132 [Hortaea werneckii]|nr:hypothetical protein KC354_g4132 [Hortaea werneckii]